MPFWSFALPLAVAAAVGPAPLAPQAAPNWTWFYARDFPEGRLDYFYDPASLQRHDGRLGAQWRVVASRDGALNLSRLEIDCGGGSITERENLLIDPEGGVRVTPASELLVDYPIESGTSSDLFRRRFCR